jgi:hypothetical protein
MVKDRIKKRLLILLALLSLQSCSKSDKDVVPLEGDKRAQYNRRIPKDNISMKQVNLEMDKIAKNSKKYNQEYDAYQKYESTEAPISLKEMKKLKRKPILNPQEIDTISGSDHSQAHPQPSNNKVIQKKAKFSKKPCMEAHCNLPEAIKYNKQNKTQTNTVAKNDNSNKTNTTKDTLIGNTALAASKTPSQTSNSKEVIKTNIPKAQNLPEIAPRDATTPTKIEISLPSISIPKTENMVKNNAEKQQPLNKETETTQPKTLTEKIIKGEVDKKNTPTLAPQNDNIGNISPPPPPSTVSGTSDIAPIAKINEQPTESKIDSINLLLIDCYYKIKLKIRNFLFN